MMKRFQTLRWTVALVVLATSLASAHGQLLDSALPAPRLLTMFPPGGKQGTTVEVTFTGVDLEEPDSLFFSHPGIKAEPILPPGPPVDPKKPAPKPPVPKAPVTHFKVTIAADVPLGVHDVRVVNRWGVSNPRAFVVGDLPEVLEKEPNNDVEQAQRIVLNSTINGNLTNPQDVDYYVFAGKKGQRVVLSVLATTIDSKFHPEVQLYNAAGKRLATGRDSHERDALCDAVLPDDGDYHIRLVEFTYTSGSPEHFYRLTVSTAPWIDMAYPPMIEPGKTASVTLWGRNLPDGKPDPNALVNGSILDRVTMNVTASADPLSRQRLNYSGRIAPMASTLDGFEYRLRGPAGMSNPVLLTYATAGVILDNEMPRTASTAQPITLPCEIAGRIERRGDRDWYAFSAKKGEVWQIDVTSERLGAPTAMYFVLRRDSTGQDIFESPDTNPMEMLKFYHRSEDPQPYRFVVPEDGKYLLLVASRLADVVYGPRHVYRVRITPEQPDFRLAVMSFCNLRPDSPTIQAGGEQGFTVVAYRQDGFTGDIQLTAEGLPSGVTCPPQVLGGSVRATTLIMTAAADAQPSLSEVRIKGTALINGQSITREARSGGIVWPLQNPANQIPTVSRLQRNLLLAVRGKAPFHLVATLDKPIVPHGDKANLKVNLTRLWPDFKQPLQVQVIEAPPNLLINNNQPVTIAPDKAEAVLPFQINPNVQPGAYNLVLRATGQVPFNKDPAAPQKPPVNVVQPAFPVTLTVVPTTLGTLALSNANPTVKAGNQAEVIVKVTRLFGYTGEYRVEVLVPPAVKGVTFDPLVIPAGRDEAKLIIKAPADAMPGNRGGLTVKATALWNASVATTTAAVPLSVNVVK